MVSYNGGNGGSVRVYMKVPVCRALCGVFSVFLAFTFRAGADSTNAAPARAEASLSARLDALRQQYGSARSEFQQASEACNRFRHDLCWTNAHLMALNKEVLQLEKVLIDKRRQLDAELDQLPEMQHLGQRRDEAYKKMQELYRRQQDIEDKIREKNAKQLR